MAEFSSPEKLPNELIVEALLRMRPADLGRAALASHSIYSLTKSQYFKRRYLEENFGVEYEPEKVALIAAERGNIGLLNVIRQMHPTALIDDRMLLIIAIRNQQFEMAKTLIDRGVDLTGYEGLMETALASIFSPEKGWEGNLVYLLVEHYYQEKLAAFLAENGIGVTDHSFMLETAVDSDLRLLAPAIVYNARQNMSASQFKKFMSDDVVNAMDIAHDQGYTELADNLNEVWEDYEQDREISYRASGYY